MIWFNDKTDIKLQDEQITSQNLKKKKAELLNRFYSLLNKYDSNSLPSKEEINEDFIDRLNQKKR